MTRHGTAPPAGDARADAVALFEPAATALAYTTSRARSYRGRPDPRAPAAGTIYRLHRATCRHAGGPSSNPVTFPVWGVLVGLARPTDDHLLCKVCQPETEEDDPCER